SLSATAESGDNQGWLVPYGLHEPCSAPRLWSLVRGRSTIEARVVPCCAEIKIRVFTVFSCVEIIPALRSPISDRHLVGPATGADRREARFCHRPHSASASAPAS